MRIPYSNTTTRHQRIRFWWRSLLSVTPFFLSYIFAFTTLLLSPPPAKANALDFLSSDFSIKDEIELGKKFKILVKSRMPLIEDPEVVTYMKDIVARLQTKMPAQPFSFDVNVVRDSSLNAFAVPGGFVFVHTGFILGIEHESELAGVLGHELGHLTQRHIAKRIKKAKQTQLLSMAGVLAGIFMGGNGQNAAILGSLAAGKAAMLNYSRQDEKEADEMGLIYLVGGGFQPQGMVGAFEAIRNARWKYGTGTVPQYLSTHPDVEKRIDYLGDRVRGLPLEVRTRPENDKRFKRVQALIRARYVDADVALQYFQQNTGYADCIGLMGKGIVFGRTNRITEARKAFAAALSCAPLDALILREAGRFEFQKGDRERAASLLQKALLINPRDYMAMFFYARVLAEKGETASAVTYFEKLVYHLPEDPEIHYFYGRTLGSVRQLFKAHLHMAYSALYENQRKKLNRHRTKAQTLAKTEIEKKLLKEFDEHHKERAEFWDE